VVTQPRCLMGKKGKGRNNKAAKPAPAASVAASSADAVPAAAPAAADTLASPPAVTSATAVPEGAWCRRARLLDVARRARICSCVSLCVWVCACVAAVGVAATRQQRRRRWRQLQPTPPTLRRPPPPLLQALLLAPAQTLMLLLLTQVKSASLLSPVEVVGGVVAVLLCLPDVRARPVGVLLRTVRGDVLWV
jgi:hypothetical protein